MKTAALTLYGLITLMAIWVFSALLKTVLAANSQPEQDVGVVLQVYLIYVINPAVFLVFIGTTFLRQFKMSKSSIGLLGQVLLCGFLLQLSIGLHALPNWSVGVAAVFLMLSCAFIFLGKQSKKI